MIKGKKTSHDKIHELLPWFVNNSLSDRERVRVMAHLGQCAKCRAERDHLQQLQALVAGEDFEFSEYRFSFKKLMVRIDEAEINRVSAEDLFVPRSGSVDLRWPLFATAASLILGVFVLAVVEPSRPTEQSFSGAFNTLTQTTSSRGIAHLVELTFEQPIKAEVLRAALIETHSSIVTGPDAEGRYLVEINVPEDMTDKNFMRSILAIDGVENATYSTHLPR